MGSQLPERANRISESTGGGGGEKQTDFLYDDSGTGTAAGLHRGPEQGQRQGKWARIGQSQGKRFANGHRARTQRAVPRALPLAHP